MTARRGTRDAELVLRLGLLSLALPQLASGLVLFLAPGAFYEAIAPFPPQSDHYMRDDGSFTLAAALALLVAVRRPGWRIPVLAFTTLQFALHSTSHLIDIDAAEGSAAGPVNFVLILAGTLLAAALLAVAAREHAPVNPPKERTER